MSISILVAMLDTRAANALTNDSSSSAGTTIRVQVEIHIQISGKLFETWTWETKGIAAN